jgi:hypothetical protein
MRRLASKLEIAELAGEAELDGESFSAETCKAAEDTLLLIADALVSGAIGVGWCVTARPQKRGRPKRTLEEIVTACHVLDDYERVLGSLKKLELEWQRNESKEQAYRRLKPLLREAWTQTIGARFQSEPSERPEDDLFDSKIVRRPPIDKDIEDALDAAITLPGHRLRRDEIAYSLVGQRWKLPISVKHLVEEARKLDK